MLPDDPRGGKLVAILRRRTPQLEALFRRHGLSAEEALTVLDEAVLEVQLRCTRVEDMDGRLMRSVKRGCAAAVRRRRAPLDAEAD